MASKTHVLFLGFLIPLCVGSTDLKTKWQEHKEHDQEVKEASENSPQKYNDVIFHKYPEVQPQLEDLHTRRIKERIYSSFQTLSNLKATELSSEMVEYVEQIKLQSMEDMMTLAKIWKNDRIVSWYTDLTHEANSTGGDFETNDLPEILYNFLIDMKDIEERSVPSKEEVEARRQIENLKAELKNTHDHMATMVENQEWNSDEVRELAKRVLRQIGKLAVKMNREAILESDSVIWLKQKLTQEKLDAESILNDIAYTLHWLNLNIYAYHTIDEINFMKRLTQYYAEDKEFFDKKPVTKMVEKKRWKNAEKTFEDVKERLGYFFIEIQRKVPNSALLKELGEDLVHSTADIKKKIEILHYFIGKMDEYYREYYWNSSMSPF